MQFYDQNTAKKRISSCSLIYFTMKHDDYVCIYIFVYYQCLLSEVGLRNFYLILKNTYLRWAHPKEGRIVSGLILLSLLLILF